MAFIDIALGVMIGYIGGNITTYFMQRYFFKKVMDKGLDHLETRIINFIKKQK